MTFNRGTLPSLANDNPGYEDCICGHPSPCQVVLPSDAANPARGRDRRGVKGWVRLRERRQRRLPSEPVPPLRDHARHVVKRLRSLDGGVDGGCPAFRMVPADDARSALQEDAVEFAVKVGLRLNKARVRRKE